MAFFCLFCKFTLVNDEKHEIYNYTAGKVLKMQSRRLLLNYQLKNESETKLNSKWANLYFGFFMLQLLFFSACPTSQQRAPIQITDDDKLIKNALGKIGPAFLSLSLSSRKKRKLVILLRSLGESQENEWKFSCLFDRTKRHRGFSCIFYVFINNTAAPSKLKRILSATIFTWHVLFKFQNCLFTRWRQHTWPYLLVPYSFFFEGETYILAYKLIVR